MNLDQFPAGIRELLTPQRAMPLGPGTPNQPLFAKLKRLTVEAAFVPQKVKDRDLARACLAGLWLYHDFLNESHQISQDLKSVEGNYWHALMHRREPDFGNSKYWFHRVGRHAVFEKLQPEAAALAEDEKKAGAARGKWEKLSVQKAWDPFAFIDLCEAAAQGKEPAELCRRIAQREWEVLFEHCLIGALGK
jgi:hypothetical protein